MEINNPMGMTGMPQKKSSGTTVVVVILLIIVLLGVYLSMRPKSADDIDTLPPATTEQSADTTAGQPAESATDTPASINSEATAGFSTSDDITSIEKDLNASAAAQ